MSDLDRVTDHRFFFFLFSTSFIYNVILSNVAACTPCRALQIRRRSVLPEIWTEGYCKVWTSR